MLRHDYTFKIGALGLATLETIVNLRNRIGTQVVRDTFNISGIENVDVQYAVRLPNAVYRKSRGRNGTYIRNVIHVYHLNDGKFLYHHPYCKLASTSSVTTEGEGLGGLIIPANVSKVTVLDLYHDLRSGAKQNAILFNVSVYVRGNDLG